LGNNYLTILPEEFGELKQLNTLYLGGNQLKALPHTIWALTQLNTLYLNINKLTTLPEEMGTLTQLTTLNLAYNKLASLPEEIGMLSELTELNLAYNKLISLPTTIGTLSQLTTLVLLGNQLKKPPIRIVEEGIGAIRRWLEEEAKQGTVENYQTKVLILGSPGVGKTTLRKKFDEIHYPLNPDEPRTVGVEIFHWNFDLMDDQKPQRATANVFDFGGQKIQYMAHQFFLSPKAFHILMMNDEHDDRTTGYWLENIRAIDHKPTVLPICNEFEGRTNHRLPTVIDTINPLSLLTVNLNSPYSEELIGWMTTIKKRIGNHILATKEPVLTHWLAIQHQLSLLTEPHIAIEAYRTLCVENKLDNVGSQNDLLIDLNKMGHVLYFENASTRVFLQPNWLIKALYTLFKPKNNLIKDSYFRREDLMKAWSKPDKEIGRPPYTGEEQDMLFHLLLQRQFNVCFQPENEKRYLVPQYLPIEPRRADWEQRSNKDRWSVQRCHYGYTFLPMGFMAQLIVSLHSLILTTERALCTWHNGMLLQLGDALALIEERDTKRVYGKHIAIEIAGPPKDEADLQRRILGVIDNLWDQHYYFYELNLYQPCEKCLLGTKKGHEFRLNDNSTPCCDNGHERPIERGNKTVSHNITNIATNGATINIGSVIQGNINIRINDEEKQEQVKQLELLIAAIKAGPPFPEKDKSVRHLENAAEAIDESKSKSDIDSYFKKGSAFLSTIEKGSKLYKKSIEILSSFGYTFT